MSESLDAPDDDAGFVSDGDRLVAAAVDRLAAELRLLRLARYPEHAAGSYRATADDAPTGPPNCMCKPCEFTGDGS